MRVLIYFTNDRFQIEVYGTNALLASCDTRDEVNALIEKYHLLVMRDFSNKE